MKRFIDDYGVGWEFDLELDSYEVGDGVIGLMEARGVVFYNADGNLEADIHESHFFPEKGYGDYDLDVFELRQLEQYILKEEL